MVDRTLRLRRRPQQLLPHLHLPLHHLRPDRRDRGQRIHLVRRKRSSVRADTVRDGVPVPLLVLLPLQAAAAARPARGALHRLLRPLLVRVLLPLPDAPRAQAPRLRHEHRMACEHGEAGADGNRTTDLPRHEALNYVACRN